jgi:RES domain-containing protein
VARRHETRRFAGDVLSGSGAARYPGRWNGAGEAVVYCATTIAMAVLETAAHVDGAGLPLNRYLVEIHVPNSTWAHVERVERAVLPATRDAIPGGRASVTFVRMAGVAAPPILLLPSVIVPEEEIALINPRHPASKAISAVVNRRYEYDLLFRNP